MSPSGRIARRNSPRRSVVFFAIATVLALIGTSCAAGSGTSSRIGSVDTSSSDETEADGGAYDPRDGIPKGESGGTDPTARGAASGDVDLGVAGGRSGGSDPMGSGTSLLGGTNAPSTVSYSMQPFEVGDLGGVPIIDKMTATTFPSQDKAIRIVWAEGRETWSYYEGTTMVIDCETRGSNWHCARTRQRIESYDGSFGVEQNIQFALQAPLFASVGVNALSPVGQTEIAGRSATCYEVASASDLICIDDASGATLRSSFDFGTSIIVEADSFAPAADPAAAAPPAPVTGCRRPAC